MSGIYIHIPFCKQACHYCDFHFSTSLNRKEEMLEVIEAELYLRREELTETVETIYFGGGTPSLLAASEITSLLDVIDRNYGIGPNPEITLEANPDDLDRTKIDELADAGVNRLSIGVQSFFAEDLEFMNRAHTEKQARASVELAASRFSNISIDLIYGIPGMDAERWRQNLRTAFDLGITHLSSYALTVENRTALDHFIKTGKCPAPSEEQAGRDFEILREEASKQDFIQYEISNFGREGFFSRHNTSYWKGVHYLGAGPSAHSFAGRSRRWNVSNNAKYIRAMRGQGSLNQTEILSDRDMLNEYLMTGLRTMWGFSLERMEELHGKPMVDRVLEQARKHFENNTLVRQGDNLLLTEKGLFLADGIASDLFVLD